jgi:predicted DCC family thiol-disulfide oxidoreductase YuxK
MLCSNMDSAAKELAVALGVPREQYEDTSSRSVLVVDPFGRVSQRSEAAWGALGALGGGWALQARLLRGVVPRALADALYGVVADNRYRLFGKKAEAGTGTSTSDACVVAPGDRERFL